jgi:HSP20 family protein
MDPAIDIFEENDEIVVKADIPGIEKGDLDVALADHILTIKGERKKEEQIDEDN